MNVRNIFVWIGVIGFLWALRVIMTDSLRFEFLVPNVVLAAVPLLIGPLYEVFGQGFSLPIRRAYGAVLGVVWLLFLPNTFYLLTDFMHLNSDVLVNMRDNSAGHLVNYARGDGLYLYDSLLLFLVAAFGLYAGGLALWQAWSWLQRFVSQVWVALILTAVMVLGAIGVYIGRFGRWNSWEGFTHPWAIIQDFFQRLQSPSGLQQFGFVLLTVLLAECLSLWWVARSQKTR